MVVLTLLSEICPCGILTPHFLNIINCYKIIVK
nr:MAG TPA: hypothetical protein [Bacteriophage sp.]